MVAGTCERAEADVIVQRDGRGCNISAVDQCSVIDDVAQLDRVQCDAF